MKKLVTLSALFLVFISITFAQDGGQFAVLEYFENPDEILITSADGEDLFPDFGMELLPGDRVKTIETVAEIRLDPNGSLIKIGQNTEFVIDTLQDLEGAEANTFSLLSGKLKMVAARSGSEKYQVQTLTAVCGVRGTIFGLEVLEGLKDLAIVEKGLIAFQKIATGDTIEVAAGQIADTFAEAFEAIAATVEQFQEFFEEIGDFVDEDMNEDAVAGNEPEVTDVSEPEVESGEEDVATTEVVTPPEPPADEEVMEEAPEEPAEPGFMEPIFEWLQDVLGMEIGTITIGDKTYSKAVLQPQFTIGRLKLGLYLPIIYQTNMFDPDDWYHPKGNDEWSFGTDYEDWATAPLPGIQDIASDLFLKIKYIQWGEQRDKFYFKVGNLNNMTIGHGILMRNYANDSDFPAIRRIGVNMGIDFGFLGFETVFNDLAEPEIFGGRIYLRPLNKVFPAAIGVAAVLDIDPAGDLVTADNPDPDLLGNPIFINGSLDIDLPIIETGFLSIILFGDAAGMVPYYREDISDGTTTIPTDELYMKALYDTEAGADVPFFDRFSNYGLTAGIFGKLFVVDYRLEYRNYQGTFQPTFYNTNYDRIRTQYVAELKEELLDTSTDEPVPTVGIYGEAGFNIGDKFRFEAGYMWPWNADGTPSNDDTLHLEAIIESGLIPVIDIHGSFSYTRTKFIPTLLAREAGLTLFDANTIMKGELIYPVAEMLDIAVLVTTTVARDANGNNITDPATGLPQISPTIGIETRVHF